MRLALGLPPTPQGVLNIFEIQSITSLKNPKVKYALKLRDSRSRRKHQEFLIDGVTEIARAWQAGFAISTLFCSTQCDDDQRLLHALEKAAAERFSGEADLSAAPVCPSPPLIVDVPISILERLSYGERDAAAVAIARTPQRDLSDLELPAAPLLLVLDRTEKPGNLGACLRTAAACGVAAVILCDPICELFNPNAIRASRGAIFGLPIATTTRNQCLDFCRRRALPIWAARVDGQRRLWDLPLAQGGALVFGNEAHGLGKDWETPQVKSFLIPMQRSTDSLNLSISAAVTLYEAFRQQASGGYEGKGGSYRWFPSK